jgi:uncharacterized protein YwqG
MKIKFRRYKRTMTDVHEYGIVLFDLKTQPTLDIMFGVHVFAIVLIKSNK